MLGWVHPAKKAFQLAGADMQQCYLELLSPHSTPCLLCNKRRTGALVSLKPPLPGRPLLACSESHQSRGCLGHSDVSVRARAPYVRTRHAGCQYVRTWDGSSSCSFKGRGKAAASTAVLPLNYPSDYVPHALHRRARVRTSAGWSHQEALNPSYAPWLAAVRCLPLARPPPPPRRPPSRPARNKPKEAGWRLHADRRPPARPHMVCVNVPSAMRDTPMPPQWSRVREREREQEGGSLVPGDEAATSNRSRTWVTARTGTCPARTPHTKTSPTRHCHAPNAGQQPPRAAVVRRRQSSPASLAGARPFPPHLHARPRSPSVPVAAPPLAPRHRQPSHATQLAGCLAAADAQHVQRPPAPAAGAAQQHMLPPPVRLPRRARLLLVFYPKAITRRTERQSRRPPAA